MTHASRNYASQPTRQLFSLVNDRPTALRIAALFLLTVIYPTRRKNHAVNTAVFFCEQWLSNFLMTTCIKMLVNILERAHVVLHCSHLTKITENVCSTRTGALALQSNVVDTHPSATKNSDVILRVFLLHGDEGTLGKQAFQQMREKTNILSHLSCLLRENKFSVLC